jgi:hypothetical protein
MKQSYPSGRRAEQSVAEELLRATLSEVILSYF